MIPYFYMLHDQDLYTGVVDHVSFLLDWCDPASAPKIKYYLYKMAYSSVKKMCKLVIL
jgi:hypothetical protein